MVNAVTAAERILSKIDARWPETVEKKARPRAAV